MRSRFPPGASKQMNGQSISIPMSKGKSSAMALMWGAMGLGALWLAYKSLDPFFWQTVHINVEGTTWLMRQLPVPLRVGVLGLIGFALLRIAVITIGRLQSDKPALTMDMDGVEGFPSGVARETIRLRWDEIGDIKSVYGNLMIYAKRDGMFKKRRLISVQTGETGMKDKDIVDAMQAFMMVSRLNPQRAQDLSPPIARSADVPLAGTVKPEGGWRPSAAPQVVTRPSSAMANAGKPTFGTRRNFN